jgi:hypothetical protein
MRYPIACTWIEAGGHEKNALRVRVRDEVRLVLDLDLVYPI